MIVTIRGHRHIIFANGCDLSIFNGFGSYSENHFNYDVLNKKTFRHKLIVASKSCEIAILYKGKFATKKILNHDEDVKGYVDKKELKKIIKKVKNYKEK